MEDVKGSYGDYSFNAVLGEDVLGNKRTMEFVSEEEAREIIDEPIRQFAISDEALNNYLSSMIGKMLKDVLDLLGLGKDKPFYVLFGKHTIFTTSLCSWFVNKNQVFYESQLLYSKVKKITLRKDGYYSFEV